MEFAKRLKNIRTERGMTQQELASSVGVSVVAIRHWEKGTRKPSWDGLVELSKALLVSSDALLGIPVSSELRALSLDERRLLRDFRKLDSYGQKAVLSVCSIEHERIIDETGVFVVRDHGTQAVVGGAKKRFIPHFATPSAAGINIPLDSGDCDMLLVDDSVPTGADYAVDIQGNSMYPLIQDGDTVYVKREEEPAIGDVGIFCVDGAMYCKQYYVDESGNLTLVSANPEMKNSNVFVSANSSNSVRFYGRVLLNRKTELPEYFRNTSHIK